jgi:hypothetical protein
LRYTLIMLAVMPATFSAPPVGGIVGPAQEKEKAASLWMKQKLGASQNILGGLTMADYGVIQ